MTSSCLKLPEPNCSLCPRLVAFRKTNQEKFPDKFNGAVPSFGDLNAEILIVGLAPGLKGANFSGRPFTGDYAGDVLYPALIKAGLAKGQFGANPNDGLELINCRITNAVRCVPPQNKPIGEEENNCLPFLEKEIEAMTNLKLILALGGIAHRAVIKTMKQRQKDYLFGHEMIHPINHHLTLVDSYHCSRYNVNTKRLTTDMFDSVIQKLLSLSSQG